MQGVWVWSLVGEDPMCCVVWPEKRKQKEAASVTVPLASWLGLQLTTTVRMPGK